MIDNTKIIEEFSLQHIYLDYCRMCLISIIEFADKEKLSTEKIDFNSDKDMLTYDSICKSENENAEQWLMNNGYKDIMYRFYYKHLFFSLLVDFSNYYIASIDMAFKGNINVAWALLRKPFQETLAYFEWLCVNKEELLELMIEGNDVSKYETMSAKLKDKRKAHIDQIQAKRGSGPIDMFDFRYSYKNEFTLNGILQATNHLITTRPALKTSPSGLNYIFPNDDIIERSIGFYYNAVPYTMLYAMDIIMKMFADIAKLGDYTVIVNRLNLHLKNLCSMKATFEKAKELMGLDEFAIYYPKCGAKHSSDEMWIEFVCEHFECEHCESTINTHQYIFDFESIEFVNNETEDEING